MNPDKWQRMLRPVLAPLGWAYGTAMRCRAAAYARSNGGFVPKAPVVSVGNIAWGGTGKTPVVRWLADRAVARGLKPVILTRGYGARPPGPHYLVRPDSDPGQAGDEPLQLARNCPQASVVVDPKRVRAARWAEAELAPDLIIMDDGFQHLAMPRRTDLVLLRPEDLGREWSRVIPAGQWREPVSALKRASAFLVRIRPEGMAALGRTVRDRLGYLDRPVFSFHLQGRGLLRAADGQRLDGLEGRSYVLVAGVGRPDRVLDTARRSLGADPTQFFAYPDHHPFTASDWELISGAAGEDGAVVCTAKDAVKLSRLADERLLVLDTDIVFGSCPLTGLEFPDWWASGHQGF